MTYHAPDQYIFLADGMTTHNTTFSCLPERRQQFLSSRSVPGPIALQHYTLDVSGTQEGPHRLSRYAREDTQSRCRRGMSFDSI
jgi:hypothetical protein